MKLTSEMVRAARALVRWNQEDLAGKAGLSLPTIKRIEAQPGPIVGRLQTAQAIERALSAAGIEFLYDRGEGVLRLKSESPREAKKSARARNSSTP